MGPAIGFVMSGCTGHGVAAADERPERRGGDSRLRSTGRLGDLATSRLQKEQLGETDEIDDDRDPLHDPQIMHVGVGLPTADDWGGIMSRSSVPPAERRRTVEGSERTVSWDTPDLDVGDSADQAIDPEELREFLAADFLECPADPIYKERLREKLWRIVRTPK